DRAAYGFDAGARESRDGFVERPAIARADRDVAAFRREQRRGGVADAAGAAGDDRLFALQSEIHWFRHPFRVCRPAEYAGWPRTNKIRRSPEHCWKAAFQ